MPALAHKSSILINGLDDGLAHVCPQTIAWANGDTGNTSSYNLKNNNPRSVNRVLPERRW